LGIGDWGLGVWPNPPNPKPQTPNPKPPTPIKKIIKKIKIKILYKKKKN